MSFKKLGLSRDMLDTLIDIGFDKPSKIQEKSIPAALEGKDIVGQAYTGTGKTAAFGIPVIEKVEEDGGLQAVILAPSRELAVQIYNELRKLSSHSKLKVVEIIGGISYEKQRRDLRRNPEIIVATPGRFIDHMERKSFDFSKVSHFVLDEADEMLSFGFLKEIKKVSAKLPKEKQTYFFTATFNKKIKTLADTILINPVNIQVSDGLTTSSKVEQKMIVLKERQKLKTLVSLLQIMKPNATMIFGRTRRRVDELSASLKQLGFKAIGIQGDMRQRERSAAMKSFRNGSINILVGTDVMARGLDIDDVDLVFNFDLPTEIEYYTHRIGRTGRADKKGVSISFVKEAEMSFFKQIMRDTKSKSIEMTIPTDADLAKLREDELDGIIEKIFKGSGDKYKGIGQRIAAKYSKEELGIIIANKLIGEKVNVHDIKITGEAGVVRKGGRGSSNRGRSNSRGRSNGGQRSGGSRGRSNNSRGRSNGGQRSGGSRGKQGSGQNRRPASKRK